MKTTIEISDAIFEAAKSLAAADGVTLRSLVEEGLRRVLIERAAGTGFEMPASRARVCDLKCVTVLGKGRAS